MKSKWTKMAIIAAAVITRGGSLAAQQPTQPMPARPIVAEGMRPAAAGPTFVVPAQNYDLPAGPGAAPVMSPAAYAARAAAQEAATEPVLAYAPSDAPTCNGCDNHRPLDGVWGSVDFVFAWTKGSSLPPLVTTSDAPNLPVLPDAPILYGDNQVGNRMLAGGRAVLGKWLDSDNTLGVAIRFFGVEGDRSGYSTDSAANPIIGRPFYNIDPFVNAQDALIVAYPAFTVGNLQVTTNTDLLSTEAMVRVNIDQDNCSRTDLVGGYHYTQIDNGLAIQSNTTVIGGNLPIDSQFLIFDSFSTRNEFHGGSIGVWHERNRGRWTVSTLGKISVGQTYQSLWIDGSNTSIDPIGGSTTTPGGILAQPATNMGHYSRNKTTYVPELNLNLTRHVTERLDFTVGYTVIWWSSVLLAGDQIDMTVNGSQFQGGTLVGPARPAFSGFHDTDYWVQGLNLGMNFRF